MPRAREGEQLGLQVGEPRGAFGKVDEPRFELRRFGRHASDFVRGRLDRDRREFEAKLLDEGRPGSGVFDQELGGIVLLSQRLGALFELWVVVAPPLDVQKVIRPSWNSQVVQTLQSFSGPPFEAVSQL